MRCGWMEVRYRFLIPMSPQYIDRVFFILKKYARRYLYLTF
jgi:hypothetical protein